MASGLDISSYRRSRKSGIGAFGVSAYEYVDMLFSISYLRSNRSVYWDFAQGRAGIVLVLWFPHNLNSVFVVSNLPEEASVLSIRRGLVTYEVAADWEYFDLPFGRKEFTEIRVAAVDPTVVNMLLPTSSIMKLACFAEQISRYEGRFRIEERGISAIFPSGTVLEKEILESGYSLWEEFKDRELPYAKCNPLKNISNVIVIVLIFLTIAVIAGALLYEMYSGK